MIHDICYVLKQLVREWRFSLACIFCLVTGMTVLATVFSLVNEVMLKPLPFHEPERLVVLRAANYANGRLNEQVALADFLDFRASDLLCVASWLQHGTARFSQ